MPYKVKFSEVLNCSLCHARFKDQGERELECKGCGNRWKMQDEVLTPDNTTHYARSFGIQWNKFERTQLDSYQRQNRSEHRLLNESGWTPDFLGGKLILDAGCGAGRFSEIALKHNGRVISVDASSAVFAARRNLKRNDSLIIQSDLEQIPVVTASVDLVFCIGVLQHTQNPQNIIKELLRVLCPQGEIVFTFYENRGMRTKLYSKYLIRPLTRRLPPEIFLKFLDKSSVFWFPITKLLFSIPYGIGRFFAYVVPIANYVNYSYLSKKHAKEEAILDTFDMLSPKYDRPITKSELRKWVSTSGFSSLELPVSTKFGTLKFKKLD